ncbi:hybrid sensor histidine kinase/response regulator [Sulfitobacter guttiformis]|uniref:histidine kinase n=1 Tax=Sulfitobacter guttiformis TaxID=74349 RepID=A0A420DH52_9RHOB|nr:PAS domain-containing protein [Sulfitobacter guttiformis]KIN72734.1 Sensor protein [Sulfitobacter guttiformis KCTC 32187]RKE93554.1 PAS domain S-box-containing protein [Sulfitobacter guttiformis]
MNIDLDAIFANAPSPYILLDPDLRMVWANNAYLELTGRSRESIIGRILTEEFPAPSDSVSDKMLRGSFRRVLANRKADHLPLISYPIEAADGNFEERFWSATHTPILDDEGRVEFILQNTFDVTDLYRDAQVAVTGENTRSAGLMQRAEAVASENLILGKATEFFQSAFDQAPGFMAVLDGPQHVFRFVNQAYNDLIGARDVVGLPVREALPDIEGQGFYELLDQVFESGESFSVKSMLAKLRSSPDAPLEEHFVDFIFYPLKDETGAPMGIFVQGHDITDQKNAEAALTATREKFRTMAQTMPVHVWTADRDGSLNWLNVRIYEFTGYSEGELYGADWVRVLHPDDLGTAVEEWTAAIEKGEGYETEFRIRKADGSFRWHIVRATPLRSDDGTLTGWVGTNTDIEERKNAEAQISKLNSTLEERVEKRNRELEELNAELRQSQKLEAIGSLAGGIAHDFNNLLQVVMGNLQIAMRSMPENSTVQKRLDQAVTSVKRGATLASQLLSFARKQPLAPVVIRLNRLVEDTKEILHSAVGEGVDLETHFEDDLWNTSVDPNSMENALLNLAINARDAMEGQGKLTIHASNVLLDKAFMQLHPDVKVGEYIRLAVTDTGCGMSNETAERIFEPFFTTKANGHGTGLGLSMVYGFAKQSGGHMALDSKIGEGTTMYIYLPRTLESEQVLQPTIDHGLVGGSETILLVEDDDEVRETAFNLLTDLGYTVFQSCDAEQALNVLDDRDDIDLLFTDVVMPGKMNGHELAQQVQILRSDIPVLFTSGFVQDAVVREGRLVEGIQLIGKPYTQVELAQKVRNVLGTEGTTLSKLSNEMAALPVQSRSESTTKSDGLSILICEDDALIRMDISEILRDAGHSIFEAANAESALNLLKEEAVDLLISDIGLPDRSGEELAQDARGLNQYLPVIFATGGVDVPSAAALGNCKVLTKPFGETVLLAAIETVMLKA